MWYLNNFMSIIRPLRKVNDLPFLKLQNILSFQCQDFSKKREQVIRMLRAWMTHIHVVIIFICQQKQYKDYRIVSGKLAQQRTDLEVADPEWRQNAKTAILDFFIYVTEPSPRKALLKGRLVSITTEFLDRLFDADLKGLVCDQEEFYEVRWLNNVTG